MTRYYFPRLTWPKVWKAVDLKSMGTMILKNQRIDGLFALEGSAPGLVYLAVNFVMVAARGDHVHLQSRKSIPAAGIFDEGVELTIHDLESERPTPKPRLRFFEYSAKPVRDREHRKMRTAATCITHDNHDFWIEGNMPGLLSLGEHCLDLAEPESSPGAELVYHPGSELADESRAFSMRRV